MTVIEYQHTPLTCKPIEPVTWYPRPEPGETAADIRLTCQHARWVKVPGYRRAWSWIEYGGRPPRANPEHTRRTWDGGYIRVHGVDPAQIIPGDRFGYWTVRRIVRNAGIYRDETRYICKCECGTISELRSSLLYGRSLSCGCWKAPNRAGHARGCICEPCKLSREVTGQLYREQTGHMPDCQCGTCAQFRQLAPMIPVILALLAELFRVYRSDSARKTSGYQIWTRLPVGRLRKT